MSAQFGTLYEYGGISNLNYGSAGKYHTVQRPDTQLLISALNETYAEPNTLLGVQICLGNVSNDDHWFYLLTGVDVTVVEDGNGKLIASPPIGITGVRIIPADVNNTFSLFVREFFPSDKIRCYSQGNFGTT